MLSVIFGSKLSVLHDAALNRVPGQSRALLARGELIKPELLVEVAKMRLDGFDRHVEFGCDGLITRWKHVMRLSLHRPAQRNKHTALGRRNRRLWPLAVDVYGSRYRVRPRINEADPCAAQLQNLPVSEQSPSVHARVVDKRTVARQAIVINCPAFPVTFEARVDRRYRRVPPKAEIGVG